MLTTLEANAALRSIRAAPGHRVGNRNATRAQLACLDRKRAKKGSNREWAHPHDRDARIAKMDRRILHAPVVCNDNACRRACSPWTELPTNELGQKPV
jgi:hypothetical protein